MNFRHHVIAVVLITLTAASRLTVAAPPVDKPEPKELLAAALTAARTITDDDERDDALMRIIRGHGVLGDFAGAGQAAKFITTPLKRGFASRAIAGAHAHAGDLKTATALADAATGDAKAGVLEEIVDAQIERGDLAGAKATRARIDDTYYASQADGRIAAAQAASGDMAGARQTLAGIRDASVKVRGYCDVAESLFKEKNLTAARDMTQRAIAASKEAPDYLRALSVAAILSTQVKTGSAQVAMATANRITDPRDKALALEKIAEAQADIGDIAGSKATAKLLTDPGDQVRLQSLFARAQAKGGDTAGARQSIAAARGLADRIEIPTLRAFAYESVLEAEVAIGDAGPAAEQARSQRDPIVKTYSLVAVARTLAKK